ncbi:hypothetical protein NKG05_23530 [Oerskovia sp. M15]
MLAVYAVARLVTAVVLLIVSRWQEANLWTDAAPSYTAWTGAMWDASWYRQIAESGYPSELPVGADGRVQQNVWAFYPCFPSWSAVCSRSPGSGGTSWLPRCRSRAGPGRCWSSIGWWPAQAAWPWPGGRGFRSPRSPSSASSRRRWCSRSPTPRRSRCCWSRVLCTSCGAGATSGPGW